MEEIAWIDSWNTDIHGKDCRLRLKDDVCGETCEPHDQSVKISCRCGGKRCKRVR
jgi:hypothetical protein